MGVSGDEDVTRLPGSKSPGGAAERAGKAARRMRLPRTASPASRVVTGARETEGGEREGGFSAAYCERAGSNATPAVALGRVSA